MSLSLVDSMKSVANYTSRLCIYGTSKNAKKTLTIWHRPCLKELKTCVTASFHSRVTSLKVSIKSAGQNQYVANSV